MVRSLLARSAIVSVALLGGAAQAQSTDSAAAGNSAPVEIIVTAQKRAEKLQDVPISMEVVSGSKLAGFAVNDFKAMTKFTPNVSVETSAGDDVIYIRGFGSPAANFSFDQSVSLYVDGVYAGRSRQSQSPLFDLERVEVLRGPQGALFGKNTAAGAVSIVSAGPTSTFRGAVNGLYNSDLTGYDVSGFVSGPLTDSLSARLAIKVLDQNGYIRNLANGHEDPENQQELARLTLKYAPSGPFDYTLKVDYGNRNVIGGLTVSSPLTTPQNPEQTRYIVDNPLGREGTKATSWMVSGTGNLALGAFTLTSVTGYSFFHSNIINDFDQSVPGDAPTLNSVYNSYPEHFRQFSQEIRLLSPTGRRFEYIVGAYYDNSQYHLTVFSGFNIPALKYFALENTEFSQRADGESVFGQGTFHFTDALRAIGSLRYTQTNKRGDFSGRLIYGPFAIRPLTTAKGDISEDNVDPSITLQYDVAPHVMTYFAYGRGSKSGGFVSNTYGTVDSTFAYKPEKSENFELGIKSTLLDGRMVLNAALYDTSFKDLQVSVYNPARSSYLTGNAASATSKGVEASMSWHATPNINFTTAAAYQDVKYDNYPGASCLATQPISECNPASPASIAANNIKGSPLPYTSKLSGNIQGDYRLDLSNDMKVDTTVSVAGRSKYFDSDNQSPLYGLQKGYAKVDLRVQLAPTSERWHVALIGKNLTNERTTGSAFNLPAPITPVPRAILYLEETRSISVEAGLRF